ncbi:hypothetical protein [Tsuneonella amylolytica]|uniref:hypothetical protein n=1 Tax=Tsuneonella amylolytica TaxID=2338327 RepID=UPI000EA8BB57|nr:hypothetical protein [Tsuneonella amylolytica]
MTRTALFAAVAALSVAAPAAAQEKPATTAQIVEAINACKAIVSSTWVDLKKLPSMGWEPYRKSTGSRQMKVGGAYEKRGNEALLVVGHDELKDKSCVVLARLGGGGAYGATAQGVSEVIGMPMGQQDFTYTWDQGAQRVTLDPSGDKAAPKARFAVIAVKGDAR